jgi:hypothetical protein
MFYETLGITQDMGTTATPHRGAPGPRGELERGRASGAGIGERGVSVARGLAGRRREGLGAQAGAWGSAPIARRATRAMGAAVAAGRQGKRLSPRAGDVETPRGRDSAPLWGALSPHTHLDDSARPGLELSGARAPGHPARRTGHCALDPRPVADEKKQPEALVPISPVSMRVAFSSSPRAAGHGLPPDSPPSSPLATSMTGSRRWPPSPCPRSASTWASTAASNRITFRPSTWQRSSERCCGTSAGMSSSSGTAAAFIAALRLRPYAGPIPGCIWKSSQRMRRNSTPQRKSGTTSQATPRLACCRTHGRAAAACRLRCAECDALRTNGAPLSSRPSCRLRRE